MSNVKNYTEQGGERTVIGGIIEIAEGGQIIIDGSNFTRSTAQADSIASDITALKDDFNALLTKLKNAGLMESN